MRATGLRFGVATCPLTECGVERGAVARRGTHLPPVRPRWPSAGRAWLSQPGTRVVVSGESEALATLPRTPSGANRETVVLGNGVAYARVTDELGPARVARAVARDFSLSSRETVVLVAATQGKSTKEIAIELGICGKTVEYFWARIFRKLRCRSHVEVMALLLRRASATVRL